MISEKKKLLVIGNKVCSPTYNNHSISLDEYIQAIESMDYVCRINRMHNYDITTGTKTNGLYIGGWPDYVNQHKGGQHTDITKSVKDIFVDKRAWVSFERHCLKFITQELKDTITICPFAELKEHIGYNYPCSVILMIDYFATTEPWCSEYEVWITGIDVDNREQVLKKGWQWLKNGHTNGAVAEQEYLQRMLKEGRIKHLEKELYESKVLQRSIPILIPVKSKSVRCPYKNETLLPYTLEYLKKLDRLKDTTIIADSDCFRHIANLYGVSYHVEDRKADGDEFTAINSFLQANPLITEFILLPATQPCRDDLLIDKVLQCSSSGTVTSYVKICDRSIFKLDSNLLFKLLNTERKGCMCKTENMADGAIYYMTRDRFYEIFNAENRNLAFWNGDIQFVENKAPFVDIDTKDELLLFLKYYG